MNDYIFILYTLNKKSFCERFKLLKYAQLHVQNTTAFDLSIFPLSRERRITCSLISSVSITNTEVCYYSSCYL